jgi:T4 bacteriophage base plate protein
MTHMRLLSASALMEVWEQGTDEYPVGRALLLLSASSGETREDLAELSIGQRDARLLEIYEQLFGSAIECFAECPRCTERLEYQVSTRDLMLPVRANEMPLVLETERARFRLRLPNSLDLYALRGCTEATTARNMLLDRCVVEASEGDVPVVLQALDEATIEKIAEYLAEADPQADTMIDLECCNCCYSWQVIFDIESLLWTKVSALAKRLLLEVHTLAQAYGWWERDILALSARRRQAYLEMAAS